MKIGNDGENAKAAKSNLGHIMKRKSALIGIFVILAGLIMTFFLLVPVPFSAVISNLSEPEYLRSLIAAAGLAGPLAVVALIAVAVVVSPLPSAPVAIAAGALYGHLWGTLLVIVGAELGAVVAFWISRKVGYDVVRRMLGERSYLKRIRSQNGLMAVVFVSRLLPFLSFDVVSYAAGLTPITFWRFAIATLAGIVPMSFLLAHFGGEFVSLDSKRILWALLALTLVMIAPLIFESLPIVRTLGRNRRKVSDQCSGNNQDSP